MFLICVCPSGGIYGDLQAMGFPILGNIIWAGGEATSGRVTPLQLVFVCCVCLADGVCGDLQVFGLFFTILPRDSLTMASGFGNGRLGAVYAVNCDQSVIISSSIHGSSACVDYIVGYLFKSSSVETAWREHLVAVRSEPYGVVSPESLDVDFPQPQ